MHAGTTRATFARWPRTVLFLARQIGLERALIFAKALLVIAVFLYQVFWISLHPIRPGLPRALSLAVSFMAVQIAVIVAEILASIVVKKVVELRTRRSDRIRPLIQPSLVAHITGKRCLPRLRSFRRWAAPDFERCLLDLLMIVEGQLRDELSATAVEIGLVDRWRRRATLGRKERKHAIESLSFLSPSVGRPILTTLLVTGSSQRRVPAEARAAIYRALIRLADPQQTGEIFHAVLREPLLVRAMVAGEFRLRTQALAARDLPRALASSDARDRLQALELVDAGSHALPLSLLYGLWRDPHPSVRAAAVRASLVGEAPATLENKVLLAARDSNSEVRTAAFHAVKRMRLRSAIPAMEAYARQADGGLSSLACLALAGMGQDGRDMLEPLIRSADHAVAARAVEALAHAGSGWRSAEGP